jgi:hypothetical protein
MRLKLHSLHRVTLCRLHMLLPAQKESLQGGLFRQLWSDVCAMVGDQVCRAMHVGASAARVGWGLTMNNEAAQ